jgi:hypothetical protein
MDSVKLMNRSDTKFVFGLEVLLKVLPKLQEYYKILEIDGIRLSAYRSLYYDTDDFLFYTQHHNGKTNRNKVRFREYLDSGLCFLEVKRKNNKGKTIKKRIKVPTIEEQLEGDSRAFVTKVVGQDYSLIPKHWNSFKRMTLVHKTQKERLTIDVDFNYKDFEQEGTIEGMIIAEVKQERKSRSSDFMRLIKEEGIQPFRISKYCMATASLYPQLKRNNFKRKFLHLSKINNND